eukprot:IDg1729t1
MKKTSDRAVPSTRRSRSRRSNQSFPKAPLAEQFVQIIDTAAASVERQGQEDHEGLAPQASPNPEDLTRGSFQAQAASASEYKVLPRVHQPNVAQVKVICENKAENQLDRIKEQRKMYQFLMLGAGTLQTKDWRSSNKSSITVVVIVQDVTAESRGRIVADTGIEIKRTPCNRKASQVIIIEVSPHLLTLLQTNLTADLGVHQ